MADEAEFSKNKKMSAHKESVKAIGDSWIVCRSQSHSGRVYYFNTLTGKSAWNLSDGEIEKAQILSQEGASGTHIGDCPEPAEPPVNTPRCSSQQHDPPKESGSRIYNKQIINNQFTKPFPIPFQNPHCPCSSLTPVNDGSLNVAPMYNPIMWAIPPPHQIFLTPTVAAMTNQAQPIFNNPNVQTTSVTLPGYFQIGNQSANQDPPHLQGDHEGRPTFNYPTKRNKGNPRNFQRNPRNFQSNLSSDLSARKKYDRNKQEPGRNEAHEPYGNISEEANLEAEDLYPSDIDEEWIKGSTVSDIPSAWKLLNDLDCWFVVASTCVMLNNMRFLTSFIEPEKQMYLITPLDVMKRLRSATGSTVPRLVQRARSALRFAVQQMNKVPAALKRKQGCTIDKCCLELIQQKYNVLLLVDDNELQSQKNINGVSMYTIDQLKEFLQNSQAFTTETRENFTVTITDSDDEKDKITSPKHEIPTVDPIEYTDELSSVQHKEIEIQTEQITPIKETVNASVQTDFEVTLTTEILKSPCPVEPLSTDDTLKVDAVVAQPPSEKKEESEVVPKKIRLKRNNLSTSSDSDPVKKTQFRWRKQRVRPPVTITTSPKADVVPNKQSLRVKSPPSSLISISDLVTPPTDNISDHAKSLEFSDASAPTSQVLERELNEESSVDECIPNPNVSKSPIIVESEDNDKRNEQEIVMFEVTGDIMDDHLSRGCDEWVSRFVQIMEEALTQILQLEPCFSDPAMPPPWSVQEAILCIKRKFENNIKIVHACRGFGVFLLKISDNSGKIFPDISPSDFMRMYSYGVNLITELQSVLNDSEDIQIAIESLSKLLSDIKNPNLDVAQNVFLDTFLTNDKHDNSANITETVPDDGDNVVINKISPQNVLKETSSDPLLTTYNLRSSQRSIEQNDIEIPQVDFVRNINKEESFFSTLKLQKNVSSTDSIPHPAFVPFSPPEQICLQNQNLSGGSETNIEDPTENTVQVPKIIRTFNICPEIEEKLKSRANGLDFDYENYDDDTNCYGNESYTEDNDYVDDAYDANTHEEMDEQYCTESDVITAQILKWFTDMTTYPVHRILTDLHRFCEDTYKELHSEAPMDQQYKRNLLEKIVEVHGSLNNVCNYLNRILRAKDTKTRFRNMMDELEFINSEPSDAQVVEYREVVRKYLDQANILFESVNLISAAIKEKK